MKPVQVIEVRMCKWCRYSGDLAPKRLEPPDGSAQAPTGLWRDRRAGTSVPQSPQVPIFGLVDDAHAAAAKSLQDAVVRDGSVDHLEAVAELNVMIRTRRKAVNDMNWLAGRYAARKHAETFETS
jgi:hypothetical protein